MNPYEPGTVSKSGKHDWFDFLGWLVLVVDVVFTVLAYCVLVVFLSLLIRGVYEMGKLFLVAWFVLPVGSWSPSDVKPVRNDFKRYGELEGTYEFIVADALLRHYRPMVNMKNLPDGSVDCYAWLRNPDAKWKSSGANRTATVNAPTLIDAKIKVTTLMKDGLE